MSICLSVDVVGRRVKGLELRRNLGAKMRGLKASSLGGAGRSLKKNRRLLSSEWILDFAGATGIHTTSGAVTK